MDLFTPEIDPNLNKEQREAIDKWIEGYNIKVTAVPGAGKSRVMIEACNLFCNGIVIILAYNHDLCEETKEKLIDKDLQDRVVCMTFHGLATYCIMPCHDDTALFDAIEGVESGELEVSKKVKVSAVLIDEAQDFRPSFHRLLNIVLDLQPTVQYMIVGDEKQMLYTYDTEDPADLKYLTSPEEHFESNREWKHIRFFQTHRLTPTMANVVSAVFDSEIQSAKPIGETYLPVYCHSINL